MATKYWPRTSLTGGVDGSLDNIDGALLTILDEDSGAAESSPDVISPDSNAGNKRWILLDVYGATLPQNLDTTDSPTFVTVKLSGLTDGKIPYHVDDATGLADGPTKADVDDAVSKKHSNATDHAQNTDTTLDSGGANEISAATLKALNTAMAYRALEYNTIFIPASGMTPTSTNGAEAGSNEYATNDINMDYLAFDGTTEEYAEFQFPMPENWDRSTIKAKFFWTAGPGSTANDTVEWKIAAGALSDSDAIDAALGTAQVISDALLADNGTDLQTSGATPAITVGGTPALGDLIHFKISRNVGGTDDMTEDAWLFGVWIQYKVTNTVVAW
jgi:hypothetical protein